MQTDTFKRKAPACETSDTNTTATGAGIRDLLYYAAAFLLTRPSILGGMMPFGAALFASEFVSRPPWVLGAFMLISSGLVTHDALSIVKYTLAALLFTAVAKKFPTLLKTPLRRGALMTLCIVLASFGVLAGTKILVYDFLITAVEGALVFGLTILFANAKRVLMTGRVNPYTVSEDLISVSVLAAALILGMGTGTYIYGINISQILCISAALLFSYAGGVGAGAVAGIAIGLTAGIADGNIAPVLGAFAISSLTSGFFSKYGKTACFLAFVSVNSLITLYTAGTSETVINLYCIFTAGSVFLLLPNRILQKFSLGLNPGMKINPDRMGGLLVHELSLLSHSINSIAKTFSHISSAGLLGADTAVAVFFDRTIKTACAGCPRAAQCWKKEFNRTYTSLFVMLQVCEKQGHLTSSALPVGISEKCVSVNRLVNTFNNMYGIYKVDKLWESRINEARTTVAHQLMSLSGKIENTAKRFEKGVTFDTSSESALTTALCQAGMPVQRVTLSRIGTQICTDIEFNKNFTPDLSLLCRIVSNISGEDMHTIFSSDRHIRLIPRGAFDIRTGYVSASAEAENGDSFGSIYSPDGKCLLVLSDGMGSGGKAQMNSAAVVTMLTHMFCAGYDTDTAINLINSVLVLKSTDTSFATVDILIINPHTASAELIKIGAAPGYFKYGDTVQVITASSLPAGVTSHPDCDKIRRKLYDSSVFVLVSDGVSDVSPGDDNWIVQIIGNYEGDSPEELSSLLLSAAQNRCGECIRDDMTVAVAIVNKKLRVG